MIVTRQSLEREHRARRDRAWRVVDRIIAKSLKAKATPDRLALSAAEVTLDRLDPKPSQTQIAAQFTGPITITWKAPSKSLSPATFNGTSSNPSNGTASASVIEGSAKRFWA